MAIEQLDIELLTEFCVQLSALATAHAAGLDAIGEDAGRQVAAAYDLLAAAARDASTLTEFSRAARTAFASPIAPIDHFLAGWTDALANKDVVDAETFALAWEAATERIGDREDLDAVCSHCCSALWSAIDDHLTMAETLGNAADAGLDEFERLHRVHGEVDPYAGGLLLLVDSLAAFVEDDDAELPAWEFPENWEAPPQRSTVETSERFDVSLVCCPGQTRTPRDLRSIWESLGTQVRVEVDDEGDWHCALVTDVAGPAIEAALSFGPCHGLVIGMSRG